MTADIIQNNLIQKQSITKRSIFASSLDVFGFLKREEMDATLNAHDLLKAAYKKLQAAESDLAQKTQRISELEKILTIDELSQLENRRGFLTRFKCELERTNRKENMGGLLVMIDLDHFKAINDTFGHSAGDEAIRVVGSYLKNTARNMDCTARLGGDEFIILMPNTSMDIAFDRAHKIGQNLNNLNFKWNGNKVLIRASIGLKEYKRGDTIESIIEDADNNMYADKEMKKKAV